MPSLRRILRKMRPKLTTSIRTLMRGGFSFIRISRVRAIPSETSTAVTKINFYQCWISKWLTWSQKSIWLNRTLKTITKSWLSWSTGQCSLMPSQRPEAIVSVSQDTFPRAMVSLLSMLPRHKQAMNSLRMLLPIFWQNTHMRSRHPETFCHLAHVFLSTR